MKFIIDEYKRTMKDYSPLEKTIFIIGNIIILGYFAYHFIPAMFE